MKLTSKELEVLSVLWKNKTSMTTTELIEASPNRTWKVGSIFSIVNTLVKKGALVLDSYKPTGTIAARAYSPAIRVEEYMASYVSSMKREDFCCGLDIDFDMIVGKMKEQWEE